VNTYLLVKWLHIVSATVLVGTGLGSAFYLFMANRSGSIQAQAIVGRLVVKADWWFTTPAIVVQPLTGWWLAQKAGFPLEAPWLILTYLLFGIAGACWLPVVWLQMQMAGMAERAAAEGSPLPARYGRFARVWEALGYPAFAAMLVVFFLMVNKPAF
jgi:uncharacterized membrane protein